MTKKPSAFRAQFSDATWLKAEHILGPLSEVSMPQPTGWFVLVAQWIRPKRVGSLIMPGQALDEDKYQGRCGIVLAVGPDAYTGDRYGAGPWCKPGDWVAWPAMENTASRMTYAGVVVTTLPDDRVVLTGVEPDLVT